MPVLTLAGKNINWSKPPKSTDRVMWSRKTAGGKKVTGSLRTIANLDHLNNLALKKFKKNIVVIQPPYNTGVKASADTHDLDAVLDVWIPGVNGGTQQSFFRANGWGAYHRTPAQGFSEHEHMFSLPVREGSNVSDDYKSGGFKVGYLIDGGWSTKGKVISSSQIADYYAHKTALKGHAHDPSWFPPNIPATIFSMPAYIAAKKAVQAASKAPAKAPVAWSSFVHLDPNSGYMDYEGAVHTAAKRSKGRAVDIDGRTDKEDTFWALHWDSIKKNGLYDPMNLIPSTANISDLTTAEVLRLRSVKGQRAHRMLYLLELAADLGVRVEAELKMLVPATVIDKILKSVKIRAMAGKGLLQWKTLALIPGCNDRMRAAHQGSLGTKAVTMLSFTDSSKPVSRSGWPYIDYTRGKTNWTA